MGTYFERYKSGEYQAVWLELVDLGEGVFESSVYDDAWAVSQITTERMLENLNRLHLRLNDIGYQLGSSEDVFDQPNPTAVEMLEELVGPVPPSLKAFFLMIGGVDFIRGKYPGLTIFPDDDASTAGNVILSDPLLICPLNLDELTYYRDNRGDDEPIVLDISDDILCKANISGGQAPFIELPDKTADPLVQVTMFGNRFVDYMRVNVEWGGFPGLSWFTTPEKRAEYENIFGYTCPPIPQDTIDYLTKDLLPF